MTRSLYESEKCICNDATLIFPVSDGKAYIDISKEVAAVNYYFNPKNSGVWKTVSDESGIKTWIVAKKQLQYGLGNDEEESRMWPCVRAETIINLPLKEIASLLMDSSRSHLINKYSSRRNVEVLHGGNAIVVSNRIRLFPSPFSFEFLNFMYCHQSRKSTVIISKSIKHESRSNTSPKSTTFLGVNVLVPITKKKTSVTSISHVKYGGVPISLVEKSVNSFIISFMKELRKQGYKNNC